NYTACSEIYTLSLHDALPISSGPAASSRSTRWRDTATRVAAAVSSLVTDAQGKERRVSPCVSRVPAASVTTTACGKSGRASWSRSEEHTSELQSRENLVCRLL